MRKSGADRPRRVEGADQATPNLGPGVTFAGESMVRSMEDEDIRALVKRLARPNRSGGAVIERAAILAESADFTSVITWIADHDGRAEDRAASVSARGLHGSRVNDAGDEERRPPLRYVLPAGTLN